MATIFCSKILTRKSLISVLNGCVLGRTVCSVNQRQCNYILRPNNYTKWLTIHRYNSNNNNNNNNGRSSIGLADELLVNKLQQSTTTSNDNNNRTTSNEGQQQQQQQDDDNKSDDKEREKTYRTLKYSFLAFGIMMCGMGTFLVYIWGSPVVDLNGNSIRDEFSDLPLFRQYFNRTLQGINDMNKMIQEPSREKLLPDPMQEPYIQPPYTLVLELRDILVHPEWTYETGWRFKKRPGVEFLLHHCAPPLFEIVIYTNEGGFTAYPIIDHLDPNGYVWYRLFKDSTRYVEGKHVKDLTCLNRDLNKVICIDWDDTAVSTSRNHLGLKRWDGNMEDQSLFELGFMLRTIAESEVSDVREVLDYYRSFDDPLAAFRENQRKAHEHELLLSQKTQAETQYNKVATSWTPSFLRRR